MHLLHHKKKGNILSGNLCDWTISFRLDSLLREYVGLFQGVPIFLFCEPRWNSLLYKSTPVLLMEIAPKLPLQQIDSEVRELNLGVWLGKILMNTEMLQDNLQLEESWVGPWAEGLGQRKRYSVGKY